MPLDVQEAVILEDLLFVLMVRIFSTLSAHDTNLTSTVFRESRAHTYPTMRTTLPTTTILLKEFDSWRPNTWVCCSFFNSRCELTSKADPSLGDLVERILPLATYYTAVTSFVEQRSHLDFGLVNHALCAAIRDMLKVRIPVPCESNRY